MVEGPVGVGRTVLPFPNTSGRASSRFVQKDQGTREMGQPCLFLPVKTEFVRKQTDSRTGKRLPVA